MGTVELRRRCGRLGNQEKVHIRTKTEIGVGKNLTESGRATVEKPQRRQRDVPKCPAFGSHCVRMLHQPTEISLFQAFLA